MAEQYIPRGPLFRDASEKAAAEARNGIIQAEYTLLQIDEWQGKCALTPDVLLKLQQLAVNQVYRCAGHFRDGPVFIKMSDGSDAHQPPPWQDVRQHVDEMCNYVREHWEDRSALHLAAYVMWRLNWIHPFLGGNGRSARALSYLVLCARLELKAPGAKTIPELIVAERLPYYKALRSADAHWAKGELDLTEMENLLESLLAKQLLSVHDRARKAAEQTTS